ncbi:MAG TPA: quinolinate synthase NadA [Candidatus Kapabacteria bacterium]|nr:quinolinate synthase NadA [Candidatus Kapabacteria bacterium]
MENITEKINRLRKERNAVILAHYYQNPQIQDIADFLGDSLALAQQAKQSNADVILFCGVHFMAETAKILNPEKVVIIPDMEAGCSLADSCPANEFHEWLKKYPDHIVISYINCSAAVKALSDIICTSSNAERIVNSVPKNQKICFAPDKYLGNFVMKKTGRNLVLWDGACQVHIEFSEIELQKLIAKHSEALILAHPECPPNILDYADFVGSTSGIINFAKKSEGKEFIIATESGIIHELKKQVSGKLFYPVPNIEGCSCNECPHMRLNTLEKIASALENLSPRIEMDEDLRLKALKPLEKMLELS